MSKINVLHIIPDQNNDVAQQQLFTQLFTLHQNMSTDFVLQALIPAGSQPFKDIPSTTYAGLPELKRAIKQAAPDIVHTHASHELRLMAHKLGIGKTVHTQHSAVSVGFFAKLGSANISNALIASTREARESLLQMGTPLQKIRMVYNGVAAVEKQDGDAFRKRYDIPSDAFVVTCFASSKNSDILFDTAKELPYNVIMLIADTNQPTLQNVRIFDNAENISELINNTNVQIYLLSDDAHAKLFAGMSAGKPTITTKDFDPYIIEDNTNGLVIPSIGAEELDDAITRLKEDPPLYEKLSAGAARCYKERFSAQRMTRDIEKIYRSLLK